MQHKYNNKLNKIVTLFGKTYTNDISLSLEN